MLRRVARGRLNRALKYLLVDVIETYFVLTGEDAQRYRRLLKRKEFRAVQEVELTWADKLVEKGREEGREEGVVEGKRKTLLRLLASKFGGLPRKVRSRAETLSEPELDSALDRLLTAATLDELKLGG